jgi:hypothetical protein
MSTGNGDQAAYPNNQQGANRGLTKREYFAGKMLQGMVSDSETIRAMSHVTSEEALDNALAVNAVRLADALLAALEKG